MDPKEFFKNGSSTEAANFDEIRNAVSENIETSGYIASLILPYRELKQRIVDAIIQDPTFKKSKNDRIEVSFKKKSLDEYRNNYNRYYGWIKKYISDHYLGMNKPYSGKRQERYSLKELSRIMTSGIVGFNVLEDAIDDLNTNDIFVNTWDDIYVEDHDGIRVYDKIFDSEDEYNNFVTQLLFDDDRQLDDGSHKKQDFEIYGMRGNAVGQSVASKGISLTIRKHSERPVTLKEMIEKKLLNERMAEFLRMIVIGETGSFISGITGSGKTTLLKALYEDALSDETLERFDTTARNKHVVVCEDTPELNLNTKNTVLMRTVQTNDESTTITLDQLILNTLRMRPRYVIVGECRGPQEIAAFVDLCSSGHGGSSTIHARGVEEAIGRLIKRYMETQGDVKTELAREFVGSSVDYIIQIGIYPEPGIGRRIIGIYEIRFDSEKERIKIKPIVEYDRASDDWIWRNPMGKKQCSVINQRGVPFKKIEEMNNFINEHKKIEETEDA